MSHFVFIWFLLFILLIMNYLLNLFLYSMSHFSKIKTNIANSDMLVKTLDKMDLRVEYLDSQHVSANNCVKTKDIVVYGSSQSQNHLLSFVWNNNQYNLVVDLQFWTLDMSFEYFVDLLSQNYAYNVILDQGSSSGFSKINEDLLTDGSIKLTLKRWSNSNLS